MRNGGVLMKQNLGATIKKYRKAAKLTQKQLAERLNKAESTVRMWELEKSKPALDTLKEIGSILNIPLGILLLSAGYIEEFKEMVDENAKKPFPIPTLSQAIRDARSDWIDQVNPYNTYDVPLDEIANKSEIPIEKLENIESGIDIALDNNELENLAEALDLPFAYLYLIQNKDTFFLGEDETRQILSRLHGLSATELNDTKHLSFEEYCKKSLNEEDKFIGFTPDEKFLTDLYNSYMFANKIENLTKIYAFSKGNEELDIYRLLENSFFNLNFKGVDLSMKKRLEIIEAINKII